MISLNRHTCWDSIQASFSFFRSRLTQEPLGYAPGLRYPPQVSCSERTLWIWWKFIWKKESGFTHAWFILPIVSINGKHIFTLTIVNKITEPHVNYSDTPSLYLLSYLHSFNLVNSSNSLLYFCHLIALFTLRVT